MKLYRPLLKGTNWALAGLLSLLGFSCSEVDSDNESAEEYGVPYATFEIKGKVQDQTGQSIPDIQIQIATGMKNYPGFISTGKYDTIPEIIKTDSRGEFSTRFGNFPVNNIKVIATDIDSTVNGSFQNKTGDIDIASGDFSGGKKWDKGTASKEITITLDEKKDKDNVK